MFDTTRATVLVVDDEELILNSLERLLRGQFEVLRARSGSDALDQLRTRPVDIIVTDQRMPGMTGAEFLAAARQLAPEVPGILLTGYSDLPDLAAAVNTGQVQAYLKKPWDSADLLGAVHKIAEQSRQRQTTHRLTQALLATESSRRLQVEQLQASEAALRQARDELEATFAAMAEAVVVYDPTGQVTRANPAAMKMVGCDPAQVDMVSLRNRLSPRHPDGRPMTLAEAPAPCRARPSPGSAMS
jgi:adenylate cyclase